MSGAEGDVRHVETLLPPFVTLVVYVVLTLAVLAPVFAVQVPCLGDYLNHLAQIHILTTVGHSPALQRFYEDHWRIVPYFGMDLPVAALARVLPLYDAGRIFVGLCVVMPVLAAAVLHYAVHRRVSLVPALGFLISYNYMLERGFLAYLFSAGLAVMLFAGWVVTAQWRRWSRASLFAAGALLLYWSHAFAFAAYGILVGGYELGRAVSSGGRPVGAVAADFAAAAAQALPVFVLLAFGHIVSDFSGGRSQFGSIWLRPIMLISPLYFAGSPWVPSAFIIVPAFGLLLLGRVRLAPALWPALAATGVVACFVPHVLLNVYGAAFRLPMVAATVFIGAVSRGPRFGRRLALGVLAMVGLLVLARAVDAAVMLRRLDAQVAQVRQVVAALPVGARLLVAEAQWNEDSGEAALLRTAPADMTGHIGLVATIDRDAFVPFLLTGPTLPVQVRPEFQRAASGNAMAVTMAQLNEGVARSDPPNGPPPSGNGGTIYWLGWKDKFDYLLVVHFGADMGALPSVLRKVAAVGVADLYQVTAW